MSLFMLSLIQREKQLNDIVNDRVDTFVDTLIEDAKDVVKADMSVDDFTADSIEEICPNFLNLKNELKSEINKYLQYSMVVR